jgi:EAL domain-containing protein (putative c-di-GMP-specific phosphodiesterase class I)
MKTKNDKSDAYLYFKNKVNFSLAFQPIVDIDAKKIFSYEALVRGINNESAQEILSHISKEEFCEFDQLVRNTALKMAANLGIDCHINLNFMPRCLQHTNNYLLATLKTCKKSGLSPSQLIIEITEEEVIHDQKKFREDINNLRSKGIKIAIDDFGAGYSGLNLLVNFQPDIIKLDMHLIRTIESHGPRQAIIKAIVQACTSLGIDIIAEGVETMNEYCWLKENQIYLFQGYLLAKPGFECLPTVYYPG